MSCLTFMIWFMSADHQLTPEDLSKINWKDLVSKIELRRFMIKSESLNENRIGIPKKPKASWKAQIPIGWELNDPQFFGYKLGVKIKNEQLNNLNPNLTSSNSSSSNPLIGSVNSTSFHHSLDLRTKYPNCWSIGFIREQSGCGSCWAVVAASILSDRHCIEFSSSTATRQRSYSYQDILENCSDAMCGTGGNGCDGGYFQAGFEYAKQIGVSTGENYGNFTGCKPYFLASKQNANNPPPGTKSCTNTTMYPRLYIYDKRKIPGYNKITGSSTQEMVNNMIDALNLRGSIMAYLDIYSDFYVYKSGVYNVTDTKQYFGGHGTRIIGYGSENGVDYWLCANSWGTSWGINGFFKILRGENAANIEAYALEPIVR